jgi:hypothetical protein
VIFLTFKRDCSQSSDQAQGRKSASVQRFDPGVIGPSCFDERSGMNGLREDVKGVAVRSGLLEECGCLLVSGEKITQQAASSLRMARATWMPFSSSGRMTSRITASGRKLLARAISAGQKATAKLTHHVKELILTPQLEQGKWSYRVKGEWGLFPGK